MEGGEDMTDWPIYIKDLRTRLGLTQRQFAEAIGATITTVSRWECGKMKPLPVYQTAIRKLEEGGTAKQ